MTADTGELRDPFRPDWHTFLPMQSPQRCGFCMSSKDEHTPPHPAIVAGGEALRRLWPGWLCDGGGIHAVQDSEMAAAVLLDAAGFDFGGKSKL